MPRSDMVKSCIRTIVRDGIDLLSDADDENDDSAYQTLARLFTTLRDWHNMNICWAMRNTISHQHQEQPGDLSGGENAEENEETQVGEETDTSHDKPGDSREADQDEPRKKHYIATCHGCAKEWTILTDPIVTCVDCGGRRQLDLGCHELLMNGKPAVSGNDFACNKDHCFRLVPPWDESLANDIPSRSVPLSAATSDLEGVSRTSITLDDWKKKHEMDYL